LKEQIIIIVVVISAHRPNRSHNNRLHSTFMSYSHEVGRDGSLARLPIVKFGSGNNS